eukprot:3247738-Rhodomonas_salina.1
MVGGTGQSGPSPGPIRPRASTPFLARSPQSPTVPPKPAFTIPNPPLDLLEFNPRGSSLCSRPYTANLGPFDHGPSIPNHNCSSKTQPPDTGHKTNHPDIEVSTPRAGSRDSTLQRRERSSA